MRALALLALAAGCISPTPDDRFEPSPYALPPPNGGFDSQLGGGYEPGPRVTIVERRIGDFITGTDYSICHVDGFQIPPEDRDDWFAARPHLILRDDAGALVFDGDQLLMDISTQSHRAEIADVFRNRVQFSCLDGFFDAVAFDHLDSYTRSGGRFGEAEAIDMMMRHGDVVRAFGRPVAQRNAPALASRRVDLSTEFVIAEDCHQRGECWDYIGAYGDRVLMIEHDRAAFEDACLAYPLFSVVLRDRNHVTPDDPAYVFDGC